MSYLALVIKPLPCCGKTVALGRPVEIVRHVRTVGYCGECQTHMTRTFGEYLEQRPTGVQTMLVPLGCIQPLNSPAQQQVHQK